MHPIRQFLILLLSISFPDVFRPSEQKATSIPTVISITDFGAVGDGKHYDTVAIQSAINSCPTAASPCIVSFPSGGTYLTSTIYLNRSNVILDIQERATLLGGARIEDYHPRNSDKWYVVLAEGVTGVGIQGGGVINGNGEKFVQEFRDDKNVMVSWNWTGACLGDECRPRLVGFVECSNVRVWNVTFRDPAYWCLNIVRCGGSVIEDVSIYGDFNSPNNDGIDIEGSNNTRVLRCHIDTGDDGICPKTLTAPVLNLTVDDCWIRSKSSAVKFGSASKFDFRNALFRNISIVDSHRGLGFQMRDGGNANNITFVNISITTRFYDPSWWGRAEPIYITSCPRDSNSSIGTVSDISFINISARSENGMLLSGSRGWPLRKIRFVNVDLRYEKMTEYGGGMADYRPGCEGLVKRRGGGAVVEFVDGVEFKNVNMTWRGNASLVWEIPLNFKAASVNDISFLNFHSDFVDS